MSKRKPKDINIYDIDNRNTGECAHLPGTSAEDACKHTGWLIEDCFIVEQRPRYKPVPHHEALLLVKIPCRTCPFQYAECLRNDTEECPVQHDAPQVTEWLKQVAQAHLCSYIGKGLRHIDYNLGRKWVKLDEAIKELTPKH